MVKALLAGGKRRWKVIGRVRNMPRNREEVIRKINNLSDEFFRKLYRMDRPTFNWLLEKIRPRFEKKKGRRGGDSIRQGENSSSEFIDPMIRLAVTLRFLAGGSYLDLAFGYHISYKHVTLYCFQVMEYVDDILDNIKFPLENEAALRELEQGFLKISDGAFIGTVAAGDGVVFRMEKPAFEEVSGDVSSFFTRKGFYAYGMQGFVDSKCRFLSISMNLCSSVHDSTAYYVSSLSQAIRDGKLPSWAHIVLDEAYVNRQQELSPFKGKNLDIWKDSFNYHLSLHRQCVERAFGILVQRWGIFWRPIRVRFDRRPLLIRVACKLHNLCIDMMGSSVPGVVRSDIRPGDSASILWSDGTDGLYRGRRSDLENTNTRDFLVNRLRNLGKTRPAHSMFSRVQVPRI